MMCVGYNTKVSKKLEGRGIIEDETKSFEVVSFEVPGDDTTSGTAERGEKDSKRRLFLRAFSLFVVGAFATTLFPKRADAIIMGSTPGSSVVGSKNAANVRINPATEETVASLLVGNKVLKKTTTLASSGTVHTPGAGKKIRVYNNKFSLTENMTSVAFRFTSGGSDYEIYLAPRTGGLYGTNNHPNYVEGGTDEVLYAQIAGTGTVQINIDYLEV